MSEDHGRASAGRREYDAVDVQLVRDVARVQGRVDGFEASLERLQSWMQGEIQSVKSNQAADSGAVAQLDTLVRGANGDNGLSSRVRALEMRVPVDMLMRVTAVEEAEAARKSAEEAAQRRWDTRTWAIVLAVFVSLLSLGSRLIFP